MNEPTMTPGAIIVEWLRNSTIAIGLILIGFAIASLIASAIGPNVPGSYTLGLVVGLALFAWFLARYQHSDIRWWEYAIGAILLVLVDTFCDRFQFGPKIQGVLIVCSMVIAKSLYVSRIRPRLNATPASTLDDDAHGSVD
jgi:thiol:disulfide interchange protein